MRTAWSKEGKALNVNRFYMFADDYEIMWIPTPKSHFIVAPLSNMFRYFSIYLVSAAE